MHLETGVVCEVVGESAPRISGRVASFLLLIVSTLIIPAHFLSGEPQPGGDSRRRIIMITTTTMTGSVCVFPF